MGCMRPSSRKEKEVWQACDQLSAEGISITYQGVGERLVELGYKRGSNSDIYRYLTTWKTMQERSDLARQMPLNGSVSNGQSDPLQHAIEQVRQDIWLEATKALTETKKQLDIKEHALAKAQDTINELKSRLIRRQKQVEELKESNETTQIMQSLLESVQGLSHSRDAELAKLYDHHQQQFDRYMKIINNLKLQNYKLKRLVAKHNLSVTDNAAEATDA